MATTKWILDPTHSELGFRIKHLMISNVSGSFKTFNAVVETEGDDFTSAQIHLTAEMGSVFTNNEQRDAHLRNSDFFEVDRFPQLQFTSTKIEKTGRDTFSLTGDLTLKGVTKPVKLAVENDGVTIDPWGNERAGFVVTGKIDRSEWGVNFGAVLETGSVMLSEEVRINSDIQVVKQVVAEPV